MNLRRPSAQRGFSLVEIMVAITLGLILLAGLIRMFTGSKQGYRLQTSTSLMQENARFASDYLAQAIRQADFWGGAEADELTDLSATADATATPCSLGWMAAYDDAVQGWTGGGTAPLPDCVTGTYVADSDMLVVRFADPDTYLSTSELTSASASDLAVNGVLWIRTQVGGGGVMFDVNDKADAVAELAGENPEAVFNFQYTAAVFFLQESASGVPTLYRRTLDSSGVSAAQPLVDGVEQLKFLYGVDSNDDGAVDRYLPAGSIAAGDWENVIAVRASMVVRGEVLDEFVDTQSYAMTPDYDFPAQTGNESRMQRRLFVEDLQVRNRTRS